MNCTKCGRAIPGGSTFCPACGEKAAAHKPETLVAFNLKKALIQPIVIVCLLVFTVMVPWQLLFLSEMGGFSSVYEQDLRDSLDSYDLELSTDSTAYNIIVFATELEFIDDLYDKAGVEPADVDTAVNSLLTIAVLLQIIAVLGLWIFFYGAQRPDQLRISTGSLTAACVSLLVSMFFILIALLVLFVNVMSISTATNEYTNYSSACRQVTSLCSGYTLMLVLGAFIILLLFISAIRLLRRVADSCDSLIPEELSRALPAAAFIAAGILLIIGFSDNALLTYLLPVGALTVYGVTALLLRSRFEQISNERTSMLLAARRSRIIKT